MGMIAPCKSGEFDPKRGRVRPVYLMHNPTGSHLDTFSHVYRENRSTTMRRSRDQWPVQVMRRVSSRWRAGSA